MHPSVLVKQFIGQGSCNAGNSLPHCEPTHLGTKEFLLTQPNAVYTVARTLDRTTRVASLTAHIERLANSLRLLLKKEPSEALAAYTDAAVLGPLIRSMLRAGLAMFQQQQKASHVQKDAKIAILICPATSTSLPLLAVHLHPFSSTAHLPECHVDVYGVPRQNPGMKHAKWVHERERYIVVKSPRSEEVLLSDPYTHEIYEGTSSNFFAISSMHGPPTVVTAPHRSVLRGTIMQVVERVCGELGIPIVYEYPRIDHVQRDRWMGAFITSTSRLVLPVTSMVFHDGNHPVRIPTCPLVETIRAAVKEAVYAEAELIEPDTESTTDEHASPAE